MLKKLVFKSKVFIYIYIYMSIPEVKGMLADLKKFNNKEDRDFIKEHEGLLNSGIKLPGGVLSGIVAQICIRGDNNRRLAEEKIKVREEKEKETKKKWEIAEGKKPNVIQVVLNDNLTDEELYEISEKVMTVVNGSGEHNYLEVKGKTKSVDKLDAILNEVNPPETADVALIKDTIDDEKIDLEGLREVYGEDNIDPEGNYRPNWRKKVGLKDAVKLLKEEYAKKNEKVETGDLDNIEEGDQPEDFIVKTNEWIDKEETDVIDELVNEVSPQDQYEDEVKTQRIDQLRSVATRLYNAKETWRLYGKYDAEIRKIAKKLDIKMNDLRGKGDKTIALEVQKLCRGLRIK